MIQIVKTFLFSNTVYFNNQFLVNQYKCDIKMNVVSDIEREQHIAMERIKAFLYEILDSAVIINMEHDEKINKLIDCGFKICTIPEDPYDQMVALMLLIKLNAITEGKLIISEITIGSTIGDNVQFICTAGDNLGPFETKGWWTDSGAKLSDKKCTNKKDKVVRLVKNGNEWDNLGLSYKEKKTKQKSAEIQFINDEN